MELGHVQTPHTDYLREKTERILKELNLLDDFTTWPYKSVSTSLHYIEEKARTILEETEKLKERAARENMANAMAKQPETPYLGD